MPAALGRKIHGIAQLPGLKNPRTQLDPRKNRRETVELTRRTAHFRTFYQFIGTNWHQGYGTF